MKKFNMFLITILVIAVIGVIGVYSAANYDDYFLAGQYLKDADTQKNKTPGITDTSGVAARYNGQDVLMSAVEYQKKLNFLRSDEEAAQYQSDFDVVNRIIEDMILLEEAENQGLTATQEEIDEMVASVQQAYEIPEGKEMLDAYCEGAGITIDEYFEIVRNIAPGSITRQKLRDEIGREYCEANGVEFSKVNPPAGMIEAQDAYVAELFEMNKDKIEYYIDIS